MPSLICLPQIFLLQLRYSIENGIVRWQKWLHIFIEQSRLRSDFRELAEGCLAEHKIFEKFYFLVFAEFFLGVGANLCRLEYALRRFVPARVYRFYI